MGGQDMKKIKAWAIMWDGDITSMQGLHYDIYHNPAHAQAAALDGEEVVEVEITIKQGECG